MVGIGQPPTYNNIEALNQAYYSQCLQSLIESIELLLDEGLELPKPLGTEFELVHRGVQKIHRVEAWRRRKRGSASCAARDE
jgi:hypothetical protein